MNPLPAFDLEDGAYRKIWKPFLPRGAWIVHAAKAFYLYGRSYNMCVELCLVILFVAALGQRFVGICLPVCCALLQTLLFILPLL